MTRPPIDDLRDRVAVVTGGASGIGKGLARALRDAGARVMIADIEAEPLARTAAELGVAGMACDVSDPASVQRLADEAVRRFGAVHVLCNNAGIGPMALIADMTLADWRWMVDVNLWGVIHGVHSFLPLLRSHGAGGHIVNTASMAALATVPRLGAYCATKFAIAAITETLRAEAEAGDYGIGVTLLCPGPVRSDLGRSRRHLPEGSDAVGLRDVELADSEQFDSIPWIEPDAVGAMVVRAILENDPLIVTHPAMGQPIRDRHARIEARLA